MNADDRSDDAPVPTPRLRRRSGRWQRWLVGLIALLFVASLGMMGWIDTDRGHAFLARQITMLEPRSGLRISVGRIDGSIYSKLVLRDVRLGDPQGMVARIPVAWIDWYPFAWFSNRLDIDRLFLPYVRLDRMPRLRPGGKDKPILPGFDIRIADLRIDRIDLGAAIAGKPRRAFVKGRADVRAGRAIVALDARTLDGGDAVRLSIDSRPDANQFDVEALALAPEGGLLAMATGIKTGFVARLTGDGDWTMWKGRALVVAHGANLSRVDIVQRAGRYRLAGTVEAAALGTGLATRLAMPRLTLLAEGAMESRIISGKASVHSDAMQIDAAGGVDLGRSSFDNLILDLRLRRAGALMRNAAGDGLVARARLMGAFTTPAYEYLLSAHRFVVGRTRIEGLRAEGRGRLALDATTAIPLAVTARHVALSSPVLDDILHDISIRGQVQLRAGILTSTPVAIRSNKIRGQVILLADVRRGSYTAGFTGDIDGIEIPKFGRVDVASRIDAVRRPGAAFRLTGTARAVMRRLDNAFLRGLGGGLPQATSSLALGGDGVIHFEKLAVSAPLIRLAARGYRSTDGQFHFTGSGTHDSYGPVRLALDGKIDRPKVDLVLEKPLPALGLANVHAVLNPDAAGYAFIADGGSRLGPFAGHGAILLPASPAPTLITVAGITVGDCIATGVLRPDRGGLVGTLDVTGPARGTVRLQLVDAIQQVAIDLALDRARFAGPPALAVNRGTLKAMIVLRPHATSIEASAQGRGIRYGTVRIGRFAASARIVEGSGTVTASATSPGNRQFDMQMRAGIEPGMIRVDGNGSLDRAPFSLARPAIFTLDDDGWRLAPTLLSYRGGSVRFEALFGGPAVHLGATINRLPLALLDLIDGDLGLGGLASGAMTYDAPVGRVPAGSVNLRVRGLTRSGLALSSAPIDMGVNAVLTADRAAIRAVVAAGGKVAGRAQALLTPLGQGSLMERLYAAPVRAQVRYRGDAGTLWRLSNIELFTLSGAAAINADIGGTVADPIIRGTVATNSATLQSPVTGMTLTGLAARGTFDGATLNFDSLSAKTRGGGSIAGSGRFLLSGERGVGIDLSATLKRAVILDRDDIAATVSGPITIRSDGDGGLISGEFNVVDSRFTLGRAEAIAAIPELRVTEVNPRGEEVEIPRAASPWRLAIKARVPTGLEVTGLGMDSEWSADLDIGGTILSPVLNGAADLIRGNYDFAGKRFELREGRLRFVGETPINPSLNIRAEANVNNVSATITVTGTSAKPIISFTSIPALPQDELLSRILFGTSITNLSAPEALQLASAIAAFQGSGGGLDPINAVRRATGLSRLRILPADATTGQRTAIAAGKNIGRSFYVELITDGQGYSATRIEYQITRWLSLIGSVSTIGRESVNLRATKDY